MHVGNLRTALLSWLVARSSGGQWLVRMEDLDRVTSSVEHEADQLLSLELLGLVSDHEVVRQSQRFERYAAAITDLTAVGRVYPCYCTRSEIRMAAHAPHGAAPDGAYPGTCRRLTASELTTFEREGRRPALRLRADSATLDAAELTVHDLVAGTYVGRADDVVLQRNDGVPAYNLAVVVDDAAQGITQVVRGDDLLESTPSHMLLQRLLHLPTPQYAHVPLVLAPDASRLAKRHGAVTLADLAARGVSAAQVLARLGASLGLCHEREVVTAESMLAGFELSAIGREPWTLTASEL